MKAIVNYSGDYVGYMLINGVAYAVDQGSTMDYLVERVTKSIQNILAGHNDMMVGYLDSTPSYDADGKKQLSFYRMRIFTKKQLEDAEISVIIKEVPTPGFG
jgi:hypothetical protein